ncbi:Ni/Fe-hydrogenase cytochrome b subunit [bacterium]|nr:Ni/Fe-hydrogenase cytochrome b subunit [bacterium]
MTEQNYRLPRPHLPTRAEVEEYENVMERYPRAPMRKPLWTPGFTAGVAIIIAGFVLVMIRLIFGLGAVTNLSDGYPWGLWITFDVVIGIALASGGYTTAALVYVFNQGQFSPLIRPAITTALLGYAMAAFGVFVDVGRWWQLYNPILPDNWNGGSALFEVSICVMAYLTILLIEYLPTLTDRWIQDGKGGLARFSMKIRPWLDKVMIVFILAGIVVSTLHQSSLGATMLIAPHRLHELWFTPWLPAFFLFSSVAVGWHVVIVESVLSAKTFGREPEMPLLAGLARRSILFLGFYVTMKFFDLVFYDKFHLLFESWYGALWFGEILVVGMIPALLLSVPWIRRNPRYLMWTSWLVIAGLIFNRANVFMLAYSPPNGWSYFPTIWEFLISAMMVAVIVVGYKLFANYFPVLDRQEPAANAKS